MESIALITGADRGLGLGLCAALLQRGWRVVAGQYMPEWGELAGLKQVFPGMLHLVPLDIGSTESVQEAARLAERQVGHIDLLVNNAGVRAETQDIRDFSGGVSAGLDYTRMQAAFNINSLGSLRMVEAFLPLTDRGVLKRLCFVSSEAGSINAAGRKAGFGYCMSKAALNMGVRLLFNRLRPEGYTFRVYHPGWIRSYMSGSKNNEANLEPEEAALPAAAYFLSDLGKDEDRLVMRDYQGREWPW